MLKLLLVVLVVLFADVNYATSNTTCDMCNITELMITPSYNITVPAGSTLSLTCSSQVSDSENCSMCLAWKHNNSDVTPAVMFNLSNGNLSSTLSVNGTVTNQGIWRCQTMETSSESAKSISIKVINVAITGNYTNIRIGSEVTVNCTVPLLPSDATIKWITQNGCVVSSTGVLMLSGNHTINNTLLTCSIDSRHQLYTSSQNEILVTVQNTRISMVAIEPNNIIALSTGRTHANVACTVTLNGDIGPNYEALSVSWMNNSPDDSKVQPLTGVAKNEFSRTLTIPLTNTGQRNYCCNASLVGNATTVSVCSTVKILDVQISKTFQNLSLGSSTSINCSVPKLLNSSIRWLSEDEQIVFNNSSVLVLETVNNTIDGKIFRCSVKSPQLYSPGGKNITVTVQDTGVSRVTINEDRVTTLKDTKNITLICSITLSAPIGPVYRDLNVTWKHNGSKVTAAKVVGNEIKTSMFTSTLPLPEVEFSNGGSYCCFASVIGSGTDEDRMDCVTLSVLDIVISGNFTDLTIGSTSYLICSVPGLETGATESGISWRRTDTSQMTSISTPANATLTLHSVESMLNGSVLTCSVSSTQLYSSGSKTITVTVKKTYVSMVSISEANLMVPVGTQTHIISCTITLSSAIGPDHSALSVTWQHNNQTLSHDEVFPTQGVSNVFYSNITLLQVSEHDGGVYNCAASLSGNETTIADQVELQVTTDGTIMISGNYTNMRIGSTVEIQCKAPMLANSIIRWLFQNGSVVSSSPVLSIESVNYSINGSVFTCSVSSSLLYSPGRKNITVTIQDTKVSLVTVEPKSTSVLIDSSEVLITCTVTLNHAIGPDHQALSVNWTHNSTQHVDPSHQSESMSSSSIEKTFKRLLTIPNVVQSSQGTYCCHAKITGSNEISDCSSVSVLVIRINGVYQDLRLGNMSTVICSVPPLEDNSAISWLSWDGSTVNNTNVLYLEGNYTINRKMFTCAVNSTQLYSSGSKNITVTVKNTYVGMVSISDTNLMIPVGTKTHIISCTITLSSAIGPDHSALNVTWQHNNQTVSHDRVQVSPTQGVSNMFYSNITLQQVSEHDGGVYNCAASLTGNETKLSDHVELNIATNGR